MNIYLIQQKDTNFFKIGITKKDPQIRLKELRTGNPFSFDLIYSYPTKYNFLLENALHAHFKLKKINLEWFELDKDDVNSFLEVCKKIENNFKILEDNFFFKKKL